MAENLDQNAIDEIISKAEADSPESRLNKLEKELDILKGSIKKLLLDIRETLNNLENPFQNLQGLAESLAVSPQQTQQPQQIQILPPPPESFGTNESETEKEEKREDKMERKFEEKKGEEEREVEKEVGGNIMSQSHPSQLEKFEEVMEKGEAVEEKPIAEEIIKKYDILTLFEIMSWVKGMLEKYSIDSVKLMLEIFESAGYIESETKDFVSKVADLIVMNDGFEDILLELYRLHKIINPHDTTMDSKLLALMLDKKI